MFPTTPGQWFIHIGGLLFHFTRWWGQIMNVCWTNEPRHNRHQLRGLPQTKVFLFHTWFLRSPPERLAACSTLPLPNTALCLLCIFSGGVRKWRRAFAHVKKSSIAVFVAPHLCVGFGVPARIFNQPANLCLVSFSVFLAGRPTFRFVSWILPTHLPSSKCSPFTLKQLYVIFQWSTPQSRKQSKSVRRSIRQSPCRLRCEKWSESCPPRRPPSLFSLSRGGSSSWRTGIFLPCCWSAITAEQKLRLPAPQVAAHQPSEELCPHTVLKKWGNCSQLFFLSSYYFWHLWRWK